MHDVDLPVPAVLTVPMAMHRGTPAKCVVSVGDYLKVGQIVGEADGPNSAHVHCSASGTVKQIRDTDPVTGKQSISVVIETDGLQVVDETLKPLVIETKEDFLAAVVASGVVGLGGAGAPAMNRFISPPPEKIDYVIINGAECEPFMTCDTRTMIDDRELLWMGLNYIKKFFGYKNIIVGVERHNKASIRSLKELEARDPVAKVHVLHDKYPQGGKINIIYNTTGRVVPEGGRPGDVGCLVTNVTTMASIMRYITTGIPMVKKRVTVDGSGVTTRKNILVPIGTPIRDVFAFCGGLRPDAEKVITGGPMMGSSIPDISQPVIKNTNTLLAFSAKDSILPEASACIRCGKCVANCPMKLMPISMVEAYERRNSERLDSLKPHVCVECGCCTFTCPAKRPLTQQIILAKIYMRKLKAQKN